MAKRKLYIDGDGTEQLVTYKPDYATWEIDEKHVLEALTNSEYDILSKAIKETEMEASDACKVAMVALDKVLEMFSPQPHETAMIRATRQLINKLKKESADGWY